MTHIIYFPWVTSVLPELASSALRSLVLAGVAGLALAAFQKKTTSLRFITWRTVLYVALAMPFLGRLLPTIPIPAPEFLQQVSGQFAPSTMSEVRQRAIVSSPAIAIHSTRVRGDERSQTVPAADASSVQAERASISWGTIAAALYTSVSLFLLIRFLIGTVFSRRLLRAARTIDDPRVARKLASRAQAASLSVAPKVVESELISVPVTVGVVRARILLPAGWSGWDETKLDAVLAHEVSHVARRDALTQRLSLLHCAIFWFSPLAWWLDRHLAVLAEEASDEAALSCGADQNEYARTLLGFFEALQSAPGRVWWQGVSMAKAGQAEQRLERILAWKGTVTMSLKRSVAVAIIALAVPVVYLTAAVRQVNHSTEFAQEPAPPAPAGAPLDPPPALSAVQPLAAAPAAGIVSSHGVPPINPVAPVAPPAPVAPVSSWWAQDHGSKSSYGHGFSYGYGYDDEQRFVIVTGNIDSLTMSGTSEDARHVEKLRKQISGDFIWFQRDEKSYIIRDQATVDRARKFWAPQDELDKKQEELGKQQEALGKQQEALGEKMEQVRVNVPDMTAALDKLKAKLQKLGPSATMEQIGDLQSEIGELQSKIGEIQSQAGEQQGKLGEEQGALGEKQGELGEKQGELGRQQGELARKAAIQMKELLDEAIKNGKARPEPDGGGASL